MENKSKNLEAVGKKSLDQKNNQNNNSDNSSTTATALAVAQCADDQSSTDNAAKHTLQTNAFDFMMKTRHKSIGRNSPGRELDANEACDKTVDKEKSTARLRKTFLANWAEAKGASKRKREYEDVGKCIEIKLKKREKNFKRMLNISHNDNNIISKKKKEFQVMESDEDGGKT